MRISDWSSDVGSSELTECGQDIGAKKREPAEEQAEVVADGGEDGIDGIAGGMGEVIAIHPVVGFEMTDDGLDGGSSVELALDGLGDASLLSCCVDLELVAIGGVVIAIAGIGDAAGEPGAECRLGGGGDPGASMI